MRIIGMAGLALLAWTGAAAGQDTIRWEPYVLRRAGQRADTVQMGRLRVPQRHGVAGGTPFEIAFARLPGRGARLGPPTVYLDGGPGGNGLGVMQVPEWDGLLERLRDQGDVILLVQRGTGGSAPRPTCAPALPVSRDLLLNRAARLEGQAQTLAACVKIWRERGVEPGSFNTQESADDIEALRKALGAPQLRLIGFSYGTHLGLALMRRHPASVASAVLIGVEGPDHTWKLPETMDRQLQHISALAARDTALRREVPDLRAAVLALLQRMDVQPITVEINPRGPELVPVRIGGDGMRYLIRRDLGDSNDLPLLPALISTTLSGDYRMLRSLVQRRYPELLATSLMAPATDCASGASPARMTQIGAQAGGSFLGAATNDWFPEICAVLGVKPLDEAFRSPLYSRIPTLFVSGTLDANTPPYQAYEVSWGWPNAGHILVQDAGHESTLVPEVAAAIDAFLETGELRSSSVRDKPLRFTLPSRVRN